MYTSFLTEKELNFDIFYAIKTNPGVLILEIIKDN
jgi:diaminopimelate decarboxylase